MKKRRGKKGTRRAEEKRKSIVSRMRAMWRGRVKEEDSRGKEKRKVGEMD